MTDGTKKRKRNTDSSSQPDNKTSLESSVKHVKISVQEVDKWAPIVASTPGVAIPTSISLQPYTKQRPNAPQRSGRNAITTTELLLHSSAHPSLDYTAREEEDGGTDALQKHYVGVYNPETGKLEVMEARKMVVRGIVRAQQASEEDETIMNYRESRTELGNLFGTKKARKTIASRTDNAIAPEKAARIAANGGKPAKLDPVAAATLATMKQATAGMATREQLAAAADASKPRPKANLNAADVQDVYTLDSLVGDSMLELVPVREWEKAVKNKKEVMVPVRYVAERIRKLASQKSPEKLKALRYVLCLMEFYNSAKASRGGRVLPKRSELRTALGDMPEPVQEDIRRKFSTAGTISKFQGDLLITSICALACVIDNFEVDIFDLAEALRLEVKEVSTYFHEIGARVVACPEAHRKLLGLDKAAAAQRKFAKLKLPLDFPKVNFPRGKR